METDLLMFQPSQYPELLIPGESKPFNDEEYTLLLSSLKTARRLDAPAFVRELEYKHVDGELTQVPKGVVNCYELHPEVRRALRELARPECKLCNASGINRWRLRGRAASVCKCVRRG